MNAGKQELKLIVKAFMSKEPKQRGYLGEKDIKKIKYGWVKAIFGKRLIYKKFLKIRNNKDHSKWLNVKYHYAEFKEDYCEFVFGSKPNCSIHGATVKF